MRNRLSRAWRGQGAVTVLLVVGVGVAVAPLLSRTASQLERLMGVIGAIGCTTAAMAIAALMRARSRDAAALARQAEELVAARAGVLAARGAAHALLVRMGMELRAPVEAMIGNGEQLAERSTSLAGSHRQLEGMLRAARRLRQLVSVVLDLARLESGRLELTPQPIAFAPLLDRLAERLGPAARAGGVSLVLPAVDADMPALIADSERYEQILLLLVDQALTTTPSGGRISLRLEEEERNGIPGVRAIIKDTGAGLQPDELPQTFFGLAPADLADTVRRTSAPSLAVALARRLAVLLGGDVTGSSPGPGLGATVVVWLPAHCAAARVAESTAGGGETRSPSGSRHGILSGRERARHADAGHPHPGGSGLGRGTTTSHPTGDHL